MEYFKSDAVVPTDTTPAARTCKPESGSPCEVSRFKVNQLTGGAVGIGSAFIEGLVLSGVCRVTANRAIKGAVALGRSTKLLSEASERVADGIVKVTRQAKSIFGNDLPDACTEFNRLAASARTAPVRAAQEAGDKVASTAETVLSATNPASALVVAYNNRDFIQRVLRQLAGNPTPASLANKAKDAAKEYDSLYLLGGKDKCATEEQYKAVVAQYQELSQVKDYSSVCIATGNLYPLCRLGAKHLTGQPDVRGVEAAQ